MPNLTASIPHRLNRADARRRIEQGLRELRCQPEDPLANLQESWTGDRMDFTLRALGQTISGHLTVDDNVIHLEVALPWLLRLAAAPVLRKIEHGVLRLLSAPAPEAPPA